MKCEKGCTGRGTMIEHIRKSFAESTECHHGGRVREAERRLGCEPLDFSANINPLGWPPIQDVLKSEMHRLGHYPDNRYTEFRKAAASFVEALPENIVPANGSSEMIRLFSETTLCEGDVAIIPFPTFGEYENQSRLFGAIIRRTDLGPFGELNVNDSSLKDAKCIFLCNPNNPTGCLLPRSRVEELARRCEHFETFLLVDEAFIELSDPDQSVARLAPQMSFITVMRSLTKSFGVPGLRLGFGVTNDEMAKIMSRARIPWSISSIASAAAVELLMKHREHLEKARCVIKNELVWLADQLERLGLKPCRSSVNFILVNIVLSGLPSAELAQRMADMGILVRDCQSFGLGENYIRVAVRNRDENERLIAALKSVLCVE
ncbi:MAG: threonine-phosphate decarboxylase CobD [Methanothrix sp.]|nr:threonine-phosphate decarboxylase CobD [Methanothrix sp.]